MTRMDVRRQWTVRADTWRWWRLRRSRRSGMRLDLCLALACVVVAVVMVRLHPLSPEYLDLPRGISADGAAAAAPAAPYTDALPVQDARALQRRVHDPPPPWGAQLQLPIALIGQPPSVHALGAFVVDPQRSLIYYAKAADQALPMASTAKVMTLLLASEQGDLNQLVTIGPDAAALVNGDNSYMGVSAGEQLTLRELLYGLVVPSGNDAAVAIADAIGGNVPSFVALMNARAQQLGLANTVYVSPDGLDDGNRTSARDLAVLTAILVMQHPELIPITATLHAVIPPTATHKGYELWSGDDLLSGARSPYPGAIGVKPGFTYAARYCQAFAAIRHGHLIVGAVLDDWSWKDRISDVRALLDWGFAQDGVPPAPAPVPWSPVSPDL